MSAASASSGSGNQSKDNGKQSRQQQQQQAKDGSNSQSQDRVPAPPLVLIDSSWLSSLEGRIRSRPIPWEGYARADLLSQDELKMIRAIDDAKGKQEADKLLDERGQQFAVLYLRLLSKLSRTDTLQQVLVLVGDQLAGRDDRAQLFFKAADSIKAGDGGPGSGSDKKQSRGGQWPWGPLIKLLDVQDDFVQLKAAQLLTLFLVVPRNSASSTLTTAPRNVLSRLLGFLSSLVNATHPSDSNPSGSSAGAGLLRAVAAANDYADGNGADIAIQLLESLLKARQFRQAVWKDESRRQGVVPSTETKTADVDDANEDQQQNDNDDDDEEGNDENTDESNGQDSKTKAIKLGQTPGLIRGLVYVLQNALVAPQGSAGGQSSSQRQDSGSPSPSGQRTPTVAVSHQMQYQVIFCFWLLSFDEDIASEINRKFGVVPLLVDVARGAVKEKVVRVSLATLRNLLVKAPSTNGSVMLGSKLLPLLELFSEKQWSDDDIVEDIKFLREELAEKLRGMSNYDEYLSELSSGKLSWDNPAHELEDFWKENAQRLTDERIQADDEADAGKINGKTKSKGSGDNENDDEETNAPDTGLKRLIGTLRSSEDPTTLSIACHDIGKIVQFHDGARKKINNLGGKVEIMKLVSHEDSGVKFAALGTVGRLMSASWR